ncbi:TPA: cytochrome c biogenesis protein CcdA [Candidatus Saccharibacteria bacterium]|nr:cytochrome c biogenesis protein CcdA [Candidatus Saccharibacteria bacterium]HIO87496.1 cytochrome c biogenesis protein CcdA [Candidatus Saccharibacteria bacterium]
MTQLIISFVAGVLTVLAPCVLPLLPVILGGSVTAASEPSKPNLKRPLVITGSLVLSIVAFSILLRSTVSSFSISDQTLQIFSGTVVVLFGLSFAVPKLWEWVALKTKFYQKSTGFFSKSTAKKSKYSDAILGLSLGPVFTSCSPTYFLIVGPLIANNFAEGLLNLIVYSIGLAGTLLLIAIGGQKIANKLGWLTNPNGKFPKILGVIFIIVGLMILFGIDKEIQEYILEQGWYDPIGNFEQGLGI